MFVLLYGNEGSDFHMCNLRSLWNIKDAQQATGYMSKLVQTVQNWNNYRENVYLGKNSYFNAKNMSRTQRMTQRQSNCQYSPMT